MVYDSDNNEENAVVEVAPPATPLADLELYYWSARGHLGSTALQEEDSAEEARNIK